MVISDMGLPRMDGASAFLKMKAINSDIKCILVSGYLEPEIKTDLLKAGAKRFVQKPYVPLDVLRNVREVIDAT